MTTKDMIVCGSFGYGNAGDEAIPEALADMLQVLEVDSRLHAVGRYFAVDDTATISLGSHDAGRLAALQGVPVVMSGGGIFENRANATVMCCKSLLSPSFTRHAELLAVSADAGVHYSWWLRQKLRWALRAIHTIYARDVLTERTINQILPSKPTKTVGDLVLWHRPDAAGMPMDVVLPERYIAVCLAPRWANEEIWMQWIAQELIALQAALELPLVFVPMTGKYDNDNEEHARVMQQIQVLAPKFQMYCMPNTLNARQVHAVFDAADLLVSSRLHGCVMAFASQVPFVGLAYHPKLLGFAETVGWREMMLPASAPNAQHVDTYGYRFASLGLQPGDLVKTAKHALKQPDFSRLLPLKQASLEALRAFLHRL